MTRGNPTFPTCCTNKQLRSWAKPRLIRLERGAIVVVHRDKLAEVAAQGFGLDPS